MRFWKKLTKFRYSKDRDEYKYHTDFSLEKGEEIEITINGETLLKEKVPVKERKYHLELAVESFKEKNDG